MAIYTLGHSTLSKEDFVDQMQHVSMIADIRSHPGSRKFPHFNKEEMEKWLPEFEKSYTWIPGLGGWRQDHMPYRDKLLKFNVDVADYAAHFPKNVINRKLKITDKPIWYIKGFWDMQYFMLLKEFANGLDELVRLGRVTDIATICCECTPWSCHRSMVSDILYLMDIESYHIMPNGKIKKHSDMIGNRVVRYDPIVFDYLQRNGVEFDKEILDKEMNKEYDLEAMKPPKKKRKTKVVENQLQLW